MPQMIFTRLLLVLSLLGLTACASKPPKNAATLSMHLPAPASLPDYRRMPVVLRMPAISLYIDKFAVLTERDLETAAVTGAGDGFAIRLVFGRHGTIELDRLSLNNRGELLVILINGVPVAAPMLKQRIVDGYFEFTPDLTREQAEKVVEGLNASIAYYKKKPF